MRRTGVQLLTIFLVALAAAPTLSVAQEKSELAPPFAVHAGGSPIDVPAHKNGHIEHDNAFPSFGDFDGDGKPDLLVGQRTHPLGQEKAGGPGGRLRIYRNIGEPGTPRFGKPTWLDDLVATARIPDG